MFRRYFATSRIVFGGSRPTTQQHEHRGCAPLGHCAMAATTYRNATYRSPQHFWRHAASWTVDIDPHPDHISRSTQNQHVFPHQLTKRTFSSPCSHPLNGDRLRLHTSHFTLHTSHFTLHTSHFTLHTSHFTPPIDPWTVGVTNERTNDK